MEIRWRPAGLALRSIGRALRRFSGELVVALAAIAAALWALHVEALLTPLEGRFGVDGRLVRMGLGAAALLAGVGGYSSVYLLLAAASIATGYTLGAPDSWAVAYTVVGSVAVASLVFYARRVYVVGGVALPSRSARDIALATVSLAFIGLWLAGSAEFLYKLGVLVYSTLTSGIDRMPYTLKEFYSKILDTRLGRVILVALTAGISARIYLYVARPLLEALSLNPRAAASELSHDIARELRLTLSGSDVSSRLASTYSTIISFMVAPLMGLLVGLARDAMGVTLREAGIGAAYSTLINVAVGFLIVSLAWALLRRLARLGAPRSMYSQARDEARFVASLLRAGSLERSLLEKALRPIVAVILYVVALIAALSLGNLIVAGTLNPATVLAGLRDSVNLLLTHRAAGEDELAFVEAYMRGYVAYLGDYMGKLEALLESIIKLLWGA